VRVLLSRGSYQCDERDCCGTTPLMDALRAGYVDITKLLINQQHVRSCSNLACMWFLTVYSLSFALNYILFVYFFVGLPSVILPLQLELLPSDI